MLSAAGCIVTADSARPLPPGSERFSLTQRELHEASGLVSSRQQADVFWALNDSGNPAVLYRLDASAQTIAAVALTGEIRNTDWEDIAMLPGMTGAPDFVLLADVGDNRARRSVVDLYFVPEPLPGIRTAQVAHHLRMRFPDGPRDCEAVSYDPLEHRLIFISKRDEPPRVYALPLHQALSQTQATAEYLFDLTSLPQRSSGSSSLWQRDSSGQPTALDISADGTQILLLTYQEAYVFDRLPGQSLMAAMQPTPRSLGLPALHQAEGAGIEAGNRSALIISEQLPTQLVRLPLTAP